MICSQGPWPVQWGPRYATQTSRQLSGKVLRYLKSLKVRPAANKSLARLNPGLRSLRWAGVTGYTKPFGVAASYVFIKQSGNPC